MTNTMKSVFASVLLAVASYTTAADATFADVIKARADLEKEIKGWKPGMEVPRRLLSWPIGKVEANDVLEIDPPSPSPILGIENEKLLEEIVFDPRAGSDSLRWAVVRLVDLKGLPWFCQLLGRREATRWEHQVLRQALQHSYSRIAVAQIEPNVMSPDEAHRALDDIKHKLDAGDNWKTAYGTVADKHPDIERRKLEPGSVGVLIGYEYSGWASATGFDFSNLQAVQFVPSDVLAQGIRAGKGGTIIQASNGLFLVYVFETYSAGR